MGMLTHNSLVELEKKGAEKSVPKAENKVVTEEKKEVKKTSKGRK